MKVALAQMLSGDQVRKNLDTVNAQVRQAAAAGAAVIIFPENCLLMQSSGLSDLARHMQQSDAIFNEISSWARTHSIAIILGAIPIATKSSRVSQSTVVWDHTGQQVSRYDKIHLFDAKVKDGHGQYRESDYIVPGDPASNIIITSFQGFNFGLTICYDLRFPELYRALRAKAAHVLVVPAAFTEVTGQAHWEPLLRARAIENQCYVLGVNQGGKHSETRETHGNTMAVDPWGTITGRLNKGTDLLFVDLSLDILNEVRQSMPVFDHRRLQLNSNL